MQSNTSSRPVRDIGIWVIVAAIAVLLGALSVARYLAFNSGMLDLGNMSQAITSVGRGAPLVFTTESGATSRLALHVELFYFLLSPFSMLWPDPRLLLSIQAVMFALGALPVYRLSLRRTESRFVARCLTIIYLLYPVAQSAVLFDFHGDTLAMPLLLFALDALDARRWRAYTIWIVLALSCKFYVALPVALLALPIWLEMRERRVALLTFAGAVLYGAIAFFVIRPLFSTAETSSDHRGLNYLAFYFGQIGTVNETLAPRLANALIVFGPVMLVAWRGWRWLLPGLPVAVAALLSTGPGGSYAYVYHHYALVVPFIVRATLDGVVQMKERQHTGKRRGRSWNGDLLLTTMIVGLCGILLIDTPLNPLFWLPGSGRGFDPSAYGIISRDGVKSQFLREHVPPEAALVTSSQLAAHVTNRETLFLLRYPDEARSEQLPRFLPHVSYAVADGLFDFYKSTAGGYGGGIGYERDAIGQLLRDGSFSLTAMRDGLLLFERNNAQEPSFAQAIAAVPSATSSSNAPVLFGDSIELLDHAIVPLGGGRFGATFTWQLLKPWSGESPVAVSSLVGVADARVVHLPSFALEPLDTWMVGQPMRETFEFELPEIISAGSYAWQIGWYDPSTQGATQSEASGLIVGSRQIVLDQIAVP